MAQCRPRVLDGALDTQTLLVVLGLVAPLEPGTRQAAAEQRSRAA